jgi:hypothetical protein
VNELAQYNDILEAFSHAFAVPAKIPIEDWCSANVKLSSDVSEYWDKNSSPWFILPLQKMFAPEIREVNLCCATGMGKTALVEAATCAVICLTPGDTLFIAKNEDLLRQYMDTRLGKIIRNCDPVQQYLPRASELQKKLILLKHMSITARAANESSLQGLSVRHIYSDECWLYSEGMLMFARRRFHGRYNSHFTKISQAGIKKSEWERDCLEGDQMYYLFPCECGAWLSFDFDKNMKWEGGEDTKHIDFRKIQQTCRIVCPHCSKEFFDNVETRRKLSSTARWHCVQEGEDNRKITFYLPSSVNFREPWSDVVRELYRAQRSAKLGDIEPLRQLTMQKFCRFWEEEYIAPHDIVVKTSNYTMEDFKKVKIQEEAARFQVIDCQMQHYWTAIFAHTITGATKMLAFKYVMSDAELIQIQKDYGVQSNMVFVDSAYEPTRIYQLCSQNGWWAILGQDAEGGFEHPIKNALGKTIGKTFKLYSRVKQVNIGKNNCKLIYLSSDRCKDILEALRTGKSGIPWEVPKDTPDLFWKQLAAEKKSEVLGKDGRSRWKWVQIAHDNHSLDLCYVDVAAQLLFGTLSLS